jgi:arsenate reductase (thioredoxin)
MGKIKVLFVCVNNSARSQMAETFLNHLAGDRFRAESAGFEPTEINPIVVEVMKEIGFDISNNQTKSVFGLFKQGRLFDYVIAVCDAAKAERCPIFPNVTKRLNWSFEDPASFTGTHEDILERTRLVRDKIKFELENFINDFPPLP